VLKRSRNVSYDTRLYRRRPPSVMMAKLIADGPTPRWTLSEEVLHQAQFIHATIAAAHRREQLVWVINLRCGRDCFTDRWPGSLAEQKAISR
jgi:hypothetical protein